MKLFYVIATYKNPTKSNTANDSNGIINAPADSNACTGSGSTETRNARSAGVAVVVVVYLERGDTQLLDDGCYHSADCCQPVLVLAAE